MAAHGLDKSWFSLCQWHGCSSSWPTTTPGGASNFFGDNQPFSIAVHFIPFSSPLLGASYSRFLLCEYSSSFFCCDFSPRTCSELKLHFCCCIPGKISAAVCTTRLFVFTVVIRSTLDSVNHYCDAHGGIVVYNPNQPCCIFFFSGPESQKNVSPQGRS